MPRVGIYCRLSIEDKNRGSDDSRSIRNQKAMLEAYCIGHGWEIFDIYVDDGFSGIDRSRPAFCRLLRDCEQGRIDIVLCKDQSRFSRDTVIIEQYLNDKFLEWGVRFIGVADNADTDSESYGTMRLFASAYNEMYVKDISAKIRRTLAYKREQGQFIGSFAPYGYRIDPADRHHLVTDPETAPVVQRIFALYVSGRSYRRIVQMLNSEGIVSPSACKRQQGSNYTNVNAETGNARGLWTQSTVAKILANEVYTGTLVQGKSHCISYKNKRRKKVDPADWVRIPDAHEAIIDADTWARTQERRNSHTRAGSRTQELPPLSGKVRCAVCGSPMKRNVYYNKARTIRYYGLQCAACKTGAMNCPNTRTVSGRMLEQAVLDALNGIAAEYCRTDEIRAPDLCAEQLGALERRLAKMQDQHAAAQKRLLAVYKDKLDGVISAEEYGRFRDSLAAEEQKTAAQIAGVQQQITKTRRYTEHAAERDALIAQYTHFDTLDRITADEFISGITVGMPEESGAREIHVQWKI